jgi:hypothetical protein
MLVRFVAHCIDTLQTAVADDVDVRVRFVAHFIDTLQTAVAGAQQPQLAGSLSLCRS